MRFTAAGARYLTVAQAAHCEAARLQDLYGMSDEPEEPQQLSFLVVNAPTAILDNLTPDERDAWDAFSTWRLRHNQSPPRHHHLLRRGGPALAGWGKRRLLSRVVRYGRAETPALARDDGWYHTVPPGYAWVPGRQRCPGTRASGRRRCGTRGRGAILPGPRHRATRGGLVVPGERQAPAFRQGVDDLLTLRPTPATTDATASSDSPVLSPREGGQVGRQSEKVAETANTTADPLDIRDFASVTVHPANLTNPAPVSPQLLSHLAPGSEVSYRPASRRPMFGAADAVARPPVLPASVPRPRAAETSPKGQLFPPAWPFPTYMRLARAVQIGVCLRVRAHPAKVRVRAGR